MSTHNLSLSRLRAMAPTHLASNTQAYVIAEKQAYKFLSLSGCQSPTEIVGAITNLPRLRVDAVDDLPTSGASEWTGTHWQILIRASEPPGRQRFTLAHELKHIIDHPFVGSDHYQAALNAEQRSHLESVCDYFAGCLLVPRPWLKRAWTSGLQDVDQLARAFGVSRPAMIVRLDQTGLRPAALTLSVSDSLARAFAEPKRSRRYERTGWTAECQDRVPELVGAV